MHLVHYNTAYGNLSNAVSRADGLAVVGIMFQADHNNHNYEPLKVKINETSGLIEGLIFK